VLVQQFFFQLNFRFPIQYNISLIYFYFPDIILVFRDTYFNIVLLMALYLCRSFYCSFDVIFIFILSLSSHHHHSPVIMQKISLAVAFTNCRSLNVTVALAPLFNVAQLVSNLKSACHLLKSA